MSKIMITGATSGIGREFASIYANRRCDLVLISRDLNELELYKSELIAKYNISVEVFAVDLSISTSIYQLSSFIEKIKIDILINNAGVGVYGSFIQSDLNEIDSMLELNIKTLVSLTYLVASQMVKNRNGKILNVASTAAFQPIPKFAVYAASKAFVLNFSEALNFELKPLGIDVCTLCPGPTATNFDKASKSSKSKLFSRDLMDAKEVARIGVKQLDDSIMTKVAGCKNIIMAFASSINPSRSLSVQISNYFVNGLKVHGQMR